MPRKIRQFAADLRQSRLVRQLAQLRWRGCCRRRELSALLVLIVTLVFSPTPALALELKVVGNQIILSGPVVGDEPGKVREALAKTLGIDTVVLRNSPGGDAPAGYRVGELLRQRGLRTAVAGYCYSSCSRMFLGGSTRYFTDDYVPENNNVGFHGHYDRMGHLNAALVRQCRNTWSISTRSPCCRRSRR
jgi:hypothetical protein